MLVGWANQEKTVGVLAEEWPREGVPGEDWKSGYTRRGLLSHKAYLQKTGVYSSTGHSIKQK